MDPKNEKKMRTIHDLHRIVQREYGKRMALQFQKAIGKITPMVITNMARDKRENNAGRIIQMVAEKYLTIQTEDLGAVAYDPSIEAMVSQMIPLSKISPKSPARRDMANIVDVLMARQFN
jgi:MinD-like ATPase involved in chromosome partitioning or flagellar assembly